MRAALRTARSGRSRSPRIIVSAPPPRLRNAPEASVHVTGANMFSNSAGTAPIADGATVPSEQKIWMRTTGPPIPVLQATATAVVPTGNVYLYDGNAGVNDAQKLIFAETATLTTTFQATAEFLEPGSLVVTKTIDGPAAGSQGQVVIHVVCDDGVARPDFVIPAGAPAGSRFRIYRNIPAATVCAVIETSNGSVAGTDVVVTGDGQEVTIPAGGRDNVHITDTYNAAPPPALPASARCCHENHRRAACGSPGAGHHPCRLQRHGAAAGPRHSLRSPAGSVSQSLDDIPPWLGLHRHGDRGRSHRHGRGNRRGQRPERDRPGGPAVPVNVTDIYYQRTAEQFPDMAQPPSGSLKVTKTIAGPSAGHQGPVAMDVAAAAVRSTRSRSASQPTLVAVLSRAFSQTSRSGPAAPSPRQPTATPPRWTRSRPGGARRPYPSTGEPPSPHRYLLPEGSSELRVGMILTSGSTAAACRAGSRLGELGVLSNTKDRKAWMPIWVGGGPGASHSCEEVPDIGDGRSHRPYTGPIQTCRPGQNWKTSASDLSPAPSGSVCSPPPV